jgi:iron complex outermembrane receptor protein
VDATLFYDDVSDEILRDRAHGQTGILRNDGATIYRNIEAYRTGIEISGRGRVGRGLTVGGDAAYVYAQNTTDDRPIAQTPPLEGRVFSSWSRGSWSATGAVRWAATQTRVDDDPKTGSGLDASATPGWAVVDLSGSWEIGSGFHLAVGLDNALDATYAHHLNRDNAFDPVRIQINEPGRRFWVRLRWTAGVR